MSRFCSGQEQKHTLNFMEIETITDKLIKQADKELTARIDQAALPLYNEISGISGGIEVQTENGDSRVLVRPYVMWNALKQVAFNTHRERNWQAKLDAFMRQVEDLSAQVEEMQSALR